VSSSSELDVAIIGVGFAGLQALYHLRAQGLRVRAFDEANDVGGTWYWNRYPGARVDVESLEYDWAFNEEIRAEWRWTERYSAQPEVLRYLQYVADRLDLRKDISFGTGIESLVLDEDEMVWNVNTRGGERVRARFVVAAVGFLSAPNVPDIPGIEDFQGQRVHTGRWPHEGIDFTGKRVGVLGTGATAVQVTPRVAEQAASVSVLQRSPMWCVPLRNMPMPPEYADKVNADFAELRRREIEESFGGFVLVGFEMGAAEKRRAMDVSAQERETDYEMRWQSGGLCFYMSFRDLLTDERANDTLREFFERKIREIVDDPATADALIPDDHPPLTKRLCGESGYYEAFNRDNVHLVNVRADPIARFTPEGVELESGARHELDVLLLATGFDAGTGPLTTHMTVAGRGGTTLKEYWVQGARTHLGLMCHGFPNLFMFDGPQSPAAFFSPPLLTDYQSRFVGRVIERLDEAGARSLEPRPEAVAEWSAYVDEFAAQTLLPRANSWWMGANIPGKPRQCLYYLGGFPEYRRRCEYILDSDFADHQLDVPVS
jgi:cyclohexanone monooxygenase